MFNQKLQDEIEVLQNDINKLQVDTDVKETRSMFKSIFFLIFNI
jgi:hypothetical protein